MSAPNRIGGSYFDQWNDSGPSLIEVSNIDQRSVGFPGLPNHEVIPSFDGEALRIKRQVRHVVAAKDDDISIPVEWIGIDEANSEIRSMVRLVREDNAVPRKLQRNPGDDSVYQVVGLVIPKEDQVLSFNVLVGNLRILLAQAVLKVVFAP